MKKRIPLLPFWLSLVFFVIAIALPTNEAEAAPKRKKTAVFKKYKTRNVSFRKSKRYRNRRSHASRCDSKKGKIQAFEMLRTTSSEQLSRLVGLENAGQPSEREPNNGTASESLVPAPTATAVKYEQKQHPLVQSAFNAPQQTAQEQLIEESEEIAELENGDDVTVNIETFRAIWLSYIEGQDDIERDVLTACGIEKKKIMDVILDWVGTSYRFGGTTRGGIDCSSFMQTVFANVGGIALPRTAAQQFTVGIPVSNTKELQFGDLVFFNTRRGVYVSHVGVYLGDDLFAHSGSRYGVTISSLESTFYSKAYIGGRRLSKADAVRMATSAEAHRTSLSE